MATFEKIKELLLSVPLHRTLMFFVTVTVSAFFIGSSSYLKNTVGGIIAESESYHSEMLFSEVIAPKVAMWEFLSGNDAAVLKEQLIDIMHNQKLSAISFTSTDGKTTVTATMPDYRPEASYMIRHSRSIADPTRPNRIIGSLQISYVNTHLQKLHDKYYYFLMILTPLLALLFYLEFLLLQNLLMPLRKIAEAVKTYRPGVPLDLHRFLRSKDDEIYEIAKGFEEMQQNIDEAMHAREEELKRSKAKDALIMRQSRFIEMGTMIQNIAHQWKQPLNIIELALTDLTVRQMTGNLSNEQQQNVYDEIHRQVEYMSRTIDTFKHFLEEDRDDEDSLPFSIKETVDTALILTGSTFKKENITLDTDVDEACCAKGNPKEFEQALLSLIHNAVDAIRMHRTAHNAITIRGAVEDDQNIITIEDTGGGFPPELAETMFDAYVTTKHMAQGTGLGLFITKTIFVMKMHGCIEAENSSEGARFTIRIPIDDACRHKAGERLISLSV
jgi:signal transduction histidine kinase